MDEDVETSDTYFKFKLLVEELLVIFTKREDKCGTCVEYIVKLCQHIGDTHDSGHEHTTPKEYVSLSINLSTSSASTINTLRTGTSTCAQKDLLQKIDFSPGVEVDNELSVRFSNGRRGKSSESRSYPSSPMKTNKKVQKRKGLATNVSTPIPESKRYKQYTRNDIMTAIEDVQGGMSALQAARNNGVPRRTLYDKIKKLGPTTNLPYRNGSVPMSPCQGHSQSQNDNSKFSPEGQELELGHPMDVPAALEQHKSQQSL